MEKEIQKLKDSETLAVRSKSSRKQPMVELNLIEEIDPKLEDSRLNQSETGN